MTPEWLDVTYPPQLTPAEAHVWFVNLALQTMERGESDLSDEELTRADRFIDRDAKAAYIGSHSTLRRLIAVYTGVSARAVKFVVGPAGKLALAERSLRFSLSHGQNFALFAFMRDFEVGVDLEPVDSKSIDPTVAARIFTAAELRSLNRLRDDERRLAFFRGWTRKEAYAKCRGISLDGLNEIETGLSESDALVNGVLLKSFLCEELLPATVAIEGKPRAIKLLRWEPERFGMGPQNM